MVGHFAGIAASIIIGGWAATFIVSQVILFVFLSMFNKPFFIINMPFCEHAIVVEPFLKTKPSPPQAVSYVVGEVLVLLLLS